MADNKNRLPVETLYEGRQNFTIVGLTGMSGSGCSQLAKYMETSDFMDFARKPDEISIKGPVETNNEKSFHENKQNDANIALSSMVFKQKYSICYNFVKSNHQPFTIIKYTKVIWLYALLYIKEKIESGEGLKDFIKKILLDKYKPSIEGRDDDYRKIISDDDRKTIISDLINNYEKWGDLAERLQKLPKNYINNLYDSDHDTKSLSDFYFKDEVFKEFFEYFLNALGKADLYSLCFFHHRMAYQIRKSGNLDEEYDKIYELENVDYNHLYDLIRLVNLLIKGYQRLDVETGKGCRIVIDSLRNSMEAQYLKERYSAFYLIAVNSKNRQTYLQRAITSKAKEDLPDSLKRLMLEKIDRLSMEEVKISDYTAGNMASPDIENVIADAEIHISNNVDENAAKNISYYEFYSMAEQWMKYYSLIMHPGLITPSADERCMVVAYSAKFNSSCISRQVGAVITNQYHSIRTIGWNEVPYGQMPCGLRDISKVYGEDTNEICHECEYSEFERGKGEYGSFYAGKGFNERIKEDYADVDEEHLAGLPKPYCFKTLHNRYEGEKNQVFTRSLHAEENAILQMAKYGGEPLMNGIIYVTASPCELCSKKLYQIGVRKIVYIDPYPGIARQQIIKAGFKQPELQIFQGAYGTTYFKLYKPFMSYKDEFDIRICHHHNIYSSKDLLNKILEKLGIERKGSYKKEEIEDVISKIVINK